MPYFMVSYDLREGQQYDDIIAELKRCGAVKYQKSSWLIETELTDVSLLATLKTYLPDEPTDMIMVIEFQTKPRCNRAFKPAIDWIAARFPTKATVVLSRLKT